jgi:transposase
MRQIGIWRETQPLRAKLKNWFGFDPRRMARPKRRREYSPKLRLRILNLRRDGLSHRAIASKIKRSYRGVGKFAKRADERESIEDLPRSGRPTKIPPKVVDYIKQALKRGLLHNVSDIQSYLKTEENLEVSKPCIRDMMAHEKYRLYKLCKKPALSSQQRKTRVTQAQQWRQYGPDFWRSVVFTDETTINRVTTDMKRTQYLPEGYPFTELRMQPTASHGGGG